MTDLDIRVEREELHTVASLAAAVVPNEIDGDGVFVTVADGRRAWWGESGDVTWCYLGGPGGECDDPVLVPARLLWSCAELCAESATDECRISAVADGAALVGAGEGFTVLVDAQNASEGVFPTFPTDFEATVTVDRRQLARILRRALNVPVGLDPATARPAVAIVVEPGSLACTVDWGDTRTLRATFNVPVNTDDAVAFEVAAEELHDLLSAVDGDDDVLLGVRPGAQGPLTVAVGDLTAWVPVRPTAVQRFRDGLGQCLADATRSRCYVLDEGIFVVELDGREVRVELHDDGLPVLRATTLVVRDVAATKELLAQLNDTNAGLCGIRLWWSDGDVIAGVDIPQSQLDELAETLWRFRTQLTGFEVFLSALGEVA
ncbi:hypothetical protein [Rhabdothermincola salaria]|uniref:hypothetical protein n=1 Tax=Rhabdothermincola salaria TaxID=2903142 RepID=UPI001E567146|nr:hypothetical protein [Rhabdothermincola salaria]MCD9624232.1 hypothetical protein [Rhabdothermincola salaria]